jgi:hypothetical protein
VNSDDLSSIPGLKEIYCSTLASELRINSLRALAEADQQAIYRALAAIPPRRPTLAQIAKWQAAARARLSQAVSDNSNWQSAASFAVIFAQRQVDRVWERRLEVERTEVEPERPHREWPDWNCEPLCGWMRSQLGLTESEQPESETDDAAETKTGPGLAPAGRAVHPGRAQLRIETATITDAAHSLNLLPADAAIAVLPEELMPPVRLSFTVRGARSGQQVKAAAWFRRHSQPGWSPSAPVIASRSGQAEFDLSSAPPGEHEVRLLAWATDAGSTLAAVTLPRLTFRHEEQVGNLGSN